LTARTVVLDASAGVAIAASAGGFVNLAHLRIVAPALFWSETLSALHQAVYRGVMSPALAAHARRALAEAPIERLEPAGVHDDAWQIADELGWAKTYDAEYVALARRLDVSLLTRDGALARGAGQLVDFVDLLSV
jgi:predicted nucleic acid-binding protein